MSTIPILFLALFCPFGLLKAAEEGKHGVAQGGEEQQHASSHTELERPSGDLLDGSRTEILQDSPIRPFTIRRDPLFPSSRLSVELPLKHPLYSSFEAKIDDVTEGIDTSLRDAERTLPAGDDQSKLWVDDLHAGHKYSVAVWGQKDGNRELIKEETVAMEPVAPVFLLEDIQAGTSNITLLTSKENRSVQDSFLIEYRQIDPEKKFPVLEVLDIPEQKQLEVYLGNLNPGREYAVRVTAVRNGRRSKPWTSTIATKPLSVSNLKVTENGSCVDLTWDSGDGGVDTYTIVYGDGIKQKSINASNSPVHLCEGVTPGLEASFVITPVKGLSQGETRHLKQILRPLAPSDFHVIPDLSKGKYRINVDLPAGSEYERCKVTAIGESLAKTEAEAAVSQKNGNNLCSLLVELPPGERFEISVQATSHSASSTRLTRSVVLTPAFDMKSFGLTLQEARGGMELLWPQSETFLARVKDVWMRLVGDGSLLQLRVTSLSTKERQRQYETTPVKALPVVVSSLVKGACYKIQGYTVTKSGIVSENRLDELKRMSAPPVNVTLTEVTRTSSTLALSLLSDEEPLKECQLSVGVLDMHSQTVLDKRLPLTKPLPSIQLNGLRPFHKYTVNTQIVCGAGSTDCPPTTRTMRQISFSTKQDKPGPVQSFTGRPLNPYSVQLGWLPPALPNGVLTHYVAEVKPLDERREGGGWTVSVGLNSERSDHALETLVDSLVGGQRYNFTVRAVTEAGPGDAPNPLTVLMPILAPPRPTVGPTTIPESVGPHTVSIRYTSAMFDSKHGKIIRSALIVTEVTEMGEVSETWMRSENRTYSWSQVQRFDVWPSYTAKLLDVPPGSRLQAPTALSESVGLDSCSERPSDEICNGPLKPGALYKFRLRLYTAPDLFTDSPYSEVIATEQSAVGVSLRTAVLLVLLLLVVAGAAATVAIFFCCSRGDNKARQAAYSSKESQWAALKMIMAERAADCLAKLGLDATQPDSSVGAMPQNNHLQPGFGHHRRCRSLRERTGVDHRLERLPSGPLHKTPLQTVLPGFNMYRNRPVRKNDFELHVRNMSADSEFRFSEEYEAMKNIGVGQSCQAADLPVNRPKNRFTNILPYDHSRVKLLNVDGEEGSDYVNANYVPGFSSRREFIAAQGPLPSTRDAFWQMAWEQQCPAIIALTKCVEKGRDKCHQYWPDQDRMSVTYGDIEVTMMFETKYDEFTVRQLRLTHLAENVAPRSIWHLHYMAWPDFGVPEHPDGIIRFAQLFRNKLPHSSQNKPTVVHCSAGVGRSGTFITIDRLLQTIQQDRPIDVFGIVYEMRLERCHMVQNEQQYIFIHHCILHALQTSGGGSPIARLISPAPADVHQNPAFEDDEGIAESGF